MVDWARRPYSTTCRFHKDSDQLVRIRWYPAHPNAASLGHPTAIQSLDWSSWFRRADGVLLCQPPKLGEVPDAARTYNGAKVLDYAKGLTPCEPLEVFSEGEHFDPARPLQQYNADHFPRCCLDRFVGQAGAFLFSGESVLSSLHPGSTCPTAQLIDLGTWYTYTLPPGGTPQRWYYPGVVGRTYRGRITPAPGAGALVFWGYSMWHPDCSSELPIANSTGSNPTDGTRVADFFSKAMLSGGNFTAAPVTYQFRIDES